jgi:hypothetical protein
VAKWSEDHGATIGSLNSNFDLVGITWLNWRLGRVLRWKMETTGWKGRGVVCGKPAPPRLYPRQCRLRIDGLPPRASIERTDRMLVL